MYVRTELFRDLLKFQFESPRDYGLDVLWDGTSLQWQWADLHAGEIRNPLAQGVSVQAVSQLIIALRVSRCLCLSFDCVSFGVLCSARDSSGATCVGWAQL